MRKMSKTILVCTIALTMLLQQFSLVAFAADDTQANGPTSNIVESEIIEGEITTTPNDGDTIETPDGGDVIETPVKPEGEEGIETPKIPEGEAGVEKPEADGGVVISPENLLQPAPEKLFEKMDAKYYVLNPELGAPASNADRGHLQYFPNNNDDGGLPGSDSWSGYPGTVDGEYADPGIGSWGIYDEEGFETFR